MSTELVVILEHGLSLAQIKELPTALDEYSRSNAGLLRLRFSHSVSGSIYEQDGKWLWKQDAGPEWALDQGVFVREERWTWHWHPERDKNFGQGFDENLNLGRVRLVSTLTDSWLSIGLHTAVLSPPIRWRNFFDPVVQTDLRHYARFLTGFFGGTSAIYVPDDIDPGCEATCKVTDGWNFDQITNYLRSEAPLAKSIEDTLETIYYKGKKGCQARGYYLDDFANLNM